MYVAHRAHQHQALIGSGLDVSRVLVDNQPAPDLSSGEPVLLPYADNLNVAGVGCLTGASRQRCCGASPP